MECYRGILVSSSSSHSSRSIRTASVASCRRPEAAAEAAAANADATLDALRARRRARQVGAALLLAVVFVGVLLARRPLAVVVLLLACFLVILLRCLPIPALSPALRLGVDLEVRETASMGKGLFAKSHIGAFTYLFDYTGEQLSEEQLVDRYPPDETGLVVADYVKELTAADFLALDPIYVDARSEENAGVARFINHGAREESRNVFMVTQRWPCRAIRCFTSQAVAEGEELLLDYGKGYWRNRESELRGEE